MPEPLQALIALLLEDNYADQRPFILAELARLSDPCGALDRLATHPSDRVRENAVRTLDSGGCADFTAYRPFLNDRSPWVVVALTRAARGQRMREAVPYLIERLADRRRIIREDRTTTIGQLAHEALAELTCHSFHDDPLAPDQMRRAAIADWKAWYGLHRDDPGDAWTQSGIALARAELSSGDGGARIEALRTLALCGAPAAATLRGAFDRAPADLQVTIACTPEDPPRVGDQIPCVLELSNVSRRRVAIAPDPGGPGVSLSRVVPAPAASPQGGPPTGKEKPSRVGATAIDVVAALVDLGPGDILRREFAAGPVPAAGRYEVRAVLRDLASDLAPTPPTPPIAATTTLRFEQ